MPRQSVQALVRAFYALAGLAFGVAAVSSIWATVSNLPDGCQLVFSQSEMVEAPGDGPIPSGLPACQQFVDILPIALALVACVGLIAAAIRFGHADPWSRLVVGIGALLGVAASALPMAVIWWASGYYDDALPDALGFVLGGVPLLVGLGAAWVTWRVHSRRAVAEGRVTVVPGPS